jgi:hypothetical protein
MAGFWIAFRGSELAQGDYLPRCLVPVVGADFGEGQNGLEITVEERDLMVVTQSCDLENAKVGFAALCPIWSLEQFETTNPKFKQKGQWEQVRRGRVEGLHLVGSTTDPANNRGALVVDFRLIISLPVGYLATHADKLGGRWRLQSPFLEHFSQAFARFFMRVGLPSTIPEFK